MSWTGLKIVIVFILVSLLLYTSVIYLGFVSVLILGLTLFISLQALATLAWKLYAWLEPSTAEKYKAPASFSQPKYTFSIIVAAHKEAAVIGDTIRAMSRINYPTKMYEVLVVLRNNDQKTLDAAHAVIAELRQNNIRVVPFSGGAKNKPRHLNIGLEESLHDVVGVFDAEDEPDPDILNLTNTVMLRDDSDVVQSSVQLMNFHSNWYSLLNVLEYFFWFKSGIILFNNLAQVTPLGGNTVFFRKEILKSIDGWSEKCLTEDALVGIELAKINAKFSIVYDAKFSTQEETPPTLESFIKQRTRWHQGFLQILTNFNWLGLKTWRQKLLVGYLLAQPLILGLFTFSGIFLLGLSMIVEVSLLISMISYVPLYLLVIILVVETLGLMEFSGLYMKSLSPKHLILLWIGYLPFIGLLSLSALRALYRIILAQNTWEKTDHINAHRSAHSLEYSVEAR